MVSQGVKQSIRDLSTLSNFSALKSVYIHHFGFLIVSIILTAAIICRRLHDIGWTGWLTILSYVVPPIIIVYGIIPSRSK
jgi:uncharacterized membrane protein YhaH (DUF805 family)